MPRPSVALALSLLFFTSITFAASEVTTTIRAPKSARPGETIVLQGIVENRGTDPATNVEVTLELSTYEPCVTRTFAVLAPGESHRITCEISLRSTLLPVLDSYLFILTATLRAGNNAAHQFIELLTDPDLSVFANAYEIRAVTPGLPAPLKVFYSNHARTAATNVSVVIMAPGEITNVPDFCVARRNQAACAVGRIEPSDDLWNPRNGSFTVEFVAPDESATELVVRLEIAAAERDVAPESNSREVTGATYRTFFLTNTNDSGSGSLRAAIEASNAECHDRNHLCQIAARIPGAGEHTIALSSPLPIVNADHVSIDASTQGRYFADSNRVAIDGSALREGHGLELDVCELEVRGFVIRDFAGHAIHVRPTRCSIATVIRDNELTGNERGIYVDAGPQGAITIRGNAINANRRAGIFISRGTNVTIARNVIGLARGNGASGVYIGPAVHGADIDDNFIAFNAHAGVAIDPFAQYVALTGNSFQANGGLAIDRGLDGVTDLALPVITSARVEGGATIIEGTVPDTWAFVNLYANDAPDPSGYGEGQYVLGLIEAQPRGRFTFIYPADLRGKWVSATMTEKMFYGFGIQNGATSTTTTEFGRAVRVDQESSARSHASQSPPAAADRTARASPRPTRSPTRTPPPPRPGA